MSVLRKRDVKATSGGEATEPAVCGLSASLPGVWEMLSCSAYSDGSRRVLSTLLLFVDEGMVKVCLNDRDQGLTAWFSGETITSCLQGLEEALARDSLQWRAPATAGRKKR